MKISDIINRKPAVRPWEDGEKIPWNDPEFSARMLQNHLSQDHDWASRRQDFIEGQLQWINQRLAPGSSILDLACGPGFYTQRLAEMGHQCLGVDFSPASIEYAQKQAAEKNLQIDYVLQDIREYQTGQSFDCVMFIFGEFNVFQAEDARKILANCRKFLKPGGLLIIEGHYFEAVRDIGLAPASWWTCEAGSGILSAKPHICLQENFWDEDSSTATNRYFTIDQDTGEARIFCSSSTAYTLEEYQAMFVEAGFSRPEILSTDDWPVGGPFEGVMFTLASRG